MKSQNSNIETQSVNLASCFYLPLAVLEKLFYDGFVYSDILAAAMLYDIVENTQYTLTMFNVILTMT